MNATQLIAVGACCWLLQGCVSSNRADRSSEQDAATANMNLGAGYLRQGRPDLAIERLLRAIAQNPRLADAQSYLALAYDQSGDAAKAEDHYRRATQLEPRNAAAANSYAVFLCRQNRWADAEQYFTSAADNPQYKTPEAALANAGLCASNAGERDKAERYFRAALNKNPVFPDALSSMLEISYQDHNYLQARAFLQRYLAVQPANAPVLLLCFDIERELDNRDGAERCALQLRSGFPQSPELVQLQERLQRDGRE